MNIFSYLKQRISILDLVNEYATLKKAGNYYKAHCPFHHEKTASFTVSPHKEIFYCFGCHVGGDVISFMAKIENCSQIDAAKLLSEQYQINLPPDLSFEYSEKQHEDKQQYHLVCKAVATWCQGQLLKTPSVLRYITQRGFTKQSIDYFYLGYFSGGLHAINALLYDMKKQNILPHDLIEANILAEGRTVLYSPFEERIIFPIFDALGNCCGFGGRTFKPNDARPKYFNSRENEYFTKGSLLFGLDRAKKQIQKTNTVFLVEGYTDCIAMVQHDYSNTVATLGTACTLAHLKLLARYAQHLYVVYDNDSAGLQALMRLTELCWQVNLELSVIMLPTGEDPASFLEKNQNLRPLINKAKDIFLFFIDSLGTDFVTKPLSQKVQITRSLLQTIQPIQDSLKQDLLLQRAAKTFDIPFESLKKELRRLAQPKTPQETSESHIRSAKSLADEIPKLEKKIFCAILNNAELFNRGNERLLIEYLPAPLSGILQQLKQANEEHKALTFSQFFDILNDGHKHYISKLLLEEQEEVDTSTYEQLLLQLHKKQWKRIVHDMKIKLAHAKQEGDEEKVAALLHDFMQLQRQVMPHITSTKNR